MGAVRQAQQEGWFTGSMAAHLSQQLLQLLRRVEHFGRDEREQPAGKRGCPLVQV